MPTHTLPVNVRWMLHSDLAAMLEIEQLCFDDPWTRQEFGDAFRCSQIVGRIAEHNNRVVAYIIYELHSTYVQITNLAVCPSRQRWGVGGAMVRELLGRVNTTRRRQVYADIRETNLDAQLFFKSLGFKATGILKGLYENPWGVTEDAYSMRLDVAAKQSAAAADETCQGR